MREPEGYRQTLEWLTEQAGGKGFISTAEIGRILGMHRVTVAKRYGIHNGCALPVLALRLTKESNTGAPGKAQRSGLAGERTSIEASESRRKRSARVDAEIVRTT